jgi:hypothetical protein
VVRHTEFLGSIIRYAVDVSGHTVLVDETHQQGTEPFAQNAAVDLLVDPDQIMVFGN